jgi:hypothetical protein
VTTGLSAVVELGEELFERGGHVAEPVRLLKREFLIDAGGSYPHAIVRCSITA